MTSSSYIAVHPARHPDHKAIQYRSPSHNLASPAAGSVYRTATTRGLPGSSLDKSGRWAADTLAPTCSLGVHTRRRQWSAVSLAGLSKATAWPWSWCRHLMTWSLLATTTPFSPMRTKTCSLPWGFPHRRQAIICIKCTRATSVRSSQHCSWHQRNIEILSVNMSQKTSHNLACTVDHE